MVTPKITETARLSPHRRPESAPPFRPAVATVATLEGARRRRRSQTTATDLPAASASAPQRTLLAGAL